MTEQNPHLTPPSDLTDAAAIRIFREVIGQYESIASLSPREQSEPFRNFVLDVEAIAAKYLDRAQLAVFYATAHRRARDIADAAQAAGLRPIAFAATRNAMQATLGRALAREGLWPVDDYFSG